MYRKNSLNPLSGIGLGYGVRGVPRDRVTGSDAEIRKLAQTISN